MKNYHQNKILPLTIKQLKKAQQQLRSRKNKVYDSASYEVIWAVARVVKLSGMDLKITDQSDVMDLVVYPDPLKEATGLFQGAYFKFFFVPKKNVLKGSNVDGFAFQISGMKRAEPNQITLHLATCLTEKLNRQKFKSKVSTKSQHLTQSHIQPQEISKISLNKQPNNTSNSLSSSSLPINKSKKIEQDITKYCQQLGSDFDIERISGHFGSKYEVKEIEKVLEILSERGAIMDLGLVYEWVGQE